MSRRIRIVAWALWGTSLTTIAASIVAALDNGSLGRTEPPVLVSAGASLAFATVGGLVLGRTGNRIGALFLTVGIFFPLAGAGDAYSFHGLVIDPGSRPLAATAALITNSAFMPAALALGAIFVLFPTGTPPSRRWRPVLFLSLLSAVLAVAGWTLRPGPINGPFNDYGVRIVNPIGITALEGILAVVFAIGVGGSLIGAALGIASVMVRFRRAQAVERQQIKWLASVGMICLILFASGFPLNAIFGETSWISSVSWEAFFLVLVFGVPGSVGMAILRYRLYDIDRVISRTLSYAIITVFLGGTFALVALVPTAIVGSGASPDWVIALATLVVAALFRPVRRRVQSAIDHRFNRTRYDAEHTVEAFAARLREHIDIDALGAELVAVVNRTMHPQHASIWWR